MNAETIIAEVRKKAKTVRTPIFQFKCPVCQSLILEGPVTFDMEDQFDCSKCGFSEEAWMFPHTILGTGRWTIGGHYSNDPLAELSFDEVIGFFTWPINPQGIVHGAGDDVFGTFEECVASLKKQGIIKET